MNSWKLKQLHMRSRKFSRNTLFTKDRLISGTAEQQWPVSASPTLSHYLNTVASVVSYCQDTFSILASMHSMIWGFTLTSWFIRLNTCAKSLNFRPQRISARFRLGYSWGIVRLRRSKKQLKSKQENQSSTLYLSGQSRIRQGIRGCACETMLSSGAYGNRDLWVIINFRNSHHYIII